MSKKPEKTVTVNGHFGDKQMTRNAFIARWTNHASDLTYLGIDVMEEVRLKAAEEWDTLYEKEHGK